MSSSLSTPLTVLKEPLVHCRNLKRNDDDDDDDFILLLFVVVVVVVFCSLIPFIASLRTVW